jgi:hypothetical protein
MISIVSSATGDGNVLMDIDASGGVVSDGLIQTYLGNGYAPTDAGTITSGSDTATYAVATIDSYTTPTSVTISAGGSAYTVSNGNLTAVTSGSGDSGMQLNITSLSTALQYSYHATLERNQ